jgi:hypothetical protein
VISPLLLEVSAAASSGDALAPVVLALVGNLSLLGVDWFQFITANTTIGVLAQLGAVILLFEVGLESTVRDMMQVGLRSLLGKQACALDALGGKLDRQHRPDARRTRRAHHRFGGLLGSRDHGDVDHLDHAAGTQVESQ